MVRQPLFPYYAKKFVANVFISDQMSHLHVLVPILMEYCIYTAPLVFFKESLQIFCRSIRRISFGGNSILVHGELRRNTYPGQRQKNCNSYNRTRTLLPRAEAAYALYDQYGEKRSDEKNGFKRFMRIEAPCGQQAGQKRGNALAHENCKIPLAVKTAKRSATAIPPCEGGLYGASRRI